MHATCTSNAHVSFLEKGETFRIPYISFRRRKAKSRQPVALQWENFISLKSSTTGGGPSAKKGLELQFPIRLWADDAVNSRRLNGVMLLLLRRRNSAVNASTHSNLLSAPAKR